MTWARIVATGLGKAAYRFVIAGLPYEFVTDRGMAQTVADGRQRVVGLLRRGLSVEQRVQLTRGLPSDTGMTVTISDAGGSASKAFAWLPGKRTYLTADASAAATSLTVASISGWADGDSVYLGGERMEVDGTPTGTTIPVTSRGSWDTYAQAHYATDGALLSAAPITDRPVQVEGRRCWLYAYGDGDSAAGNGTLVFAGVCSTDARRGADGATFTIGVDSRARLLAQTFGGAFDAPVYPRGIYYPDSAPLVIHLQIHSSAADDASVAERARVFLTGFYEDQDAFCRAFNTLMATTISGFTNQPVIRAMSRGVDGWDLIVTTASTARYVRVHCVSAQDGEVGPVLATLATDADVHSVSSSTAYRVRATPGGDRAYGSVPRGVFGGARRPYLTDDATAAVGAASPRAIYYGGAFDAATEDPDLVAIDWPAVAGLAETRTVHVPADASDGATRYLELATTGGPATAMGRPYFRDALPAIHFATVAASGNVADLVSTLTSNAATRRNAGYWPDIITDDVDQSEWTALAGTMSDRAPTMSERNYWLGKGVRLDKLLSAELMAVGCYLATDSTGRLVPRRYVQATAGDARTIDVSTSRIKHWSGLPAWEKQALGDAHTIKIQNGTDPIAEKPISAPAIVTDAEAWAKNPNAQVLSIDLYSAPAAHVDRPFHLGDAQAIAAPILGMLGHEYAVIDIETDMACHAVQIGDVVTLTHAHIPDWQNGTRGVTALPGVVIARRAEYDTLRMRLRVYVSGLDVAGYAPSAGITAQTNVSGNIWDLTLSLADPLGVATWGTGTEGVSDHFAVGDQIVISQWNTTSAVTVTGDVTTVGASSMRVTLDGAWTPGTDAWTVEFDASTACTTAQLVYAFIADSDMRIDLPASATRAARVYGA